MSLTLLPLLGRICGEIPEDIKEQLGNQEVYGSRGPASNALEAWQKSQKRLAPRSSRVTRTRFSHQTPKPDNTRTPNVLIQQFQQEVRPSIIGENET